MEKKYFADFDFTDFWSDSEASKEQFIEQPVTDEMIEKVERVLGYKLPAAYIEMMREHNGGYIDNEMGITTPELRECGEMLMCLCAIRSIGEKKVFSLLGQLGSQFLIDEWGYPPIGIAFGEADDAGHSAFFLDYRKCGPQGEPEVVWIDEVAGSSSEDGVYPIYFMAKDFETFIKALRPCREIEAELGLDW